MKNKLKRIIFALVIVSVFTLTIAGCGKKKLTTRGKSNTTTKVTTRLAQDNKVVKFDTNGGSNILDANVENGKLLTKPANPTKDYYEFDNWYTSNDFNDLFDFNTPIKEDVTLYAKWTPIEYKINYVLNEGTNNANNAKTSNIENEAITLLNPERFAYKFMGWYTTSDFKDETKITAIPKGLNHDITLYAKWEEIEKCTVFFETFDVEEIEPITVLFGETIIEPTAPILEHYNFGGWYKDKEYKEKFDFNSKITSDISLYLYMIPVEYTINYELNDGLNGDNPESSNITNGEIELKNATREGFDFVGWYTTSEFTPGTRIQAIPASLTKELTIYAKFSVHNYTISYVTNGGVTNNPSQSNVLNDAIPLTDASKNYSTFIGWYTDIDFTNEITEIPAHLDHNMTIFAKFELVKFEIDYQLNGGTNNSNNIATFTVDTRFTFLNPTKEYSTFEGWFTDTTYLTRLVSINPGVYTDKLTLYAKWSDTVYQIKYMGSDYINPNTVTEYTYYSAPSLQNASKDGYKFLGWYDNASFNGDAITSLTGLHSNINLYPKFEAISYTISFVTDGGSSVSDVNYTIEDNVDLSTITSTPTDISLIFAYWVDNNNKIINEIEKGTTGNITLTAIYTDKKFTVTFTNYDDSVLASFEVANKEEAVYPYDNPTKPATFEFMYEFKGWDASISSIETDITVKAVYNEIRYLYFDKSTDGTHYIVYGATTSQVKVMPSVINIPSVYGSDDDELPVTEIKTGAFNGRSEIKELTIPSSITVLNSSGTLNAFSGLKGLEVLNYNAISANDLANSSNLTSYGLFRYIGINTKEGTTINIGSDVTYIPNYLFNVCGIGLSNSKIKEINFLGNKITKIGNYAFGYLTTEKVVLPDGITTIGDYAFIHNTFLKEIYIPNSVTYLGTSILGNCNTIEKISTSIIGKNKGQTGVNTSYFGYFFGTTSSTNAQYISQYYSTSSTNSAYIPNSLKTIVINEGTEMIPFGAFSRLYNVENIYIPSSVTKMYARTFYEAKGLKYLYFDANLTTSFESASYNFYGAGVTTVNDNNEIFKVVIGKDVLAIPDYFFNGYNANYASYSNYTSFSYINEFEFESGTKLEKIGKFSFAYLPFLKEFIVPETVTNIDNYAFAYDYNLKTIDIGKIANVVGTYAFANCPNLYNVYINKECLSFAEYAFYDDKEIENVYYHSSFNDWMNVEFANSSANPMEYARRFFIFEDGEYKDLTVIDLSGETITEIPSYAFAGFNYVKTIILPNTVEIIDDYAFYNMQRLTSINIPESVTYIGDYAFSNCYSIKTLTVPESVKHIGENAFAYCTALKDINIPVEVEYLGAFTLQGCESLTTITLPTNYELIPTGFIADCINISEVILPSGIEVIPNSLFQGLKKLKSITLPDTIKAIEGYAFERSGIESITIPKNCEYIDMYAFSECKNLKSIEFALDGDKSNLAQIKGFAFANSGLEELELPIGVEYVDYNAFTYCDKLKSVTIPSSVLYIGHDAFSYCTKLENVYFDCTLEYSLYYNNSYYYNYQSNMFIKAGINSEGVTITIGKNVEYLPEYFFGYNNSRENAPKIKAIIFDADNLTALTNYTNSYSYEWSNYYSYAFDYVEYIALLDIPGSVEIIPYCFCEYVGKIDTLKINKGTTYIDYDAFYYAGEITNFYLTNTIEKINSYAFYNAKIVNLYFDGTLDELQNIVYYSSNNNLYDLAINVYCKNDKDEFYIVKEAPTDGILDSSLYDGKTFDDEENKFIIPAGTKFIPKNAFNNINGSFTSLYFEGTLEEWLRIEFADSSSNPLSRVQNFYYKENGEYVKLSKDIVIPNSITKLNSYAFNYCSFIENVDLNNVTEISSNAFYSCYNLKNVTMSDNLNTIGPSAFYNCTSLEEIVIPSSVTTIYTSAFENCTKLKKATINSSVIGKYMFYDCYNLNEVILSDNLKTIDDYAFYYCSNLEQITFTDSIEKIGEYAFYNLYKLKFDALPKNIKEIEKYAFDNLDEITSLYIPSTLKTMGEYAFYDCDKLESVVCDGEIIGPYAFSYCDALTSFKFNGKILDDFALYCCYSLTDLDLGENLEKIGKYVLENDNCIKNLVIPKSVTSVSDYAFSYVYNLENVKIYCDVLSSNMFYGATGCFKIELLGNVEEIPDYCFLYVNGLTEITIPSTVTKVGYHAFESCSSLAKVVIKNNLLGYGMFDYCSQLSTVIFEGEIEEIAEAAFYCCSQLSSITIPSTVTVINDEAFYGCYNLYFITNYSDLVLDAGYTDNGYVAYYAKVINGEAVDDDVEYIIEGDFVFVHDATSSTDILLNYIGNDEEIVLPDSFTSKNDGLITSYTLSSSFIPSNKYVKSLVISSAVKELNDSQFSYYYNLVSVTLPSTIKTIPSSAFYNCSKLESINIEGVTSIDEYAFYYCSKLSNIDLSNCETILDYAFAYCGSLEKVSLPKCTTLSTYAFYYCSMLKEADIPLLEEISSYAFYDCVELLSVTSTTNLESIGQNAFTYCYKLKTIDLSNVTEISYCAFYSCRELVKANLSSLTALSNQAFQDCQKLEEVILSSSITEIPYWAFGSCYALTTINLGNIKVFGEGAFTYCYELENIDFTSATEFGTSSFYYAKGNETLDLGANVTFIGSYAFAYNKNLKNLSLPTNEEFTMVSTYAFQNCENLENVIIPDNVMTVGTNAFSGCSSIKNLSLGKSITSIDTSFIKGLALESIYYNMANYSPSYNSSSLFYYFNSKDCVITIGKDVEVLPKYFMCSNDYTNSEYKDLVFEDESSLKTVSQYAFYYSIFKKVDLPSSVTTIEKYAFYYSYKLEEVTLNGSVADYGIYNCTYLKKLTLGGGCTLNSKSSIYYSSANLQEVAIAEGVKALPDNLFYGYQNLIKANIPSTITTFGTSVFYNCSKLQSVDIANGIETIPNNTFYQCTVLENVDIPTSIKAIGDYAFRYCSNIKGLDLSSHNQLLSIGNYAFNGCSSITNLILPDSLETIGQYAFQTCYALKSVTLGKNLKTINNYAFNSDSQLYYVRNLSSLVLTIGATSNGYVAYYAKQVITNDTDEFIRIVDGDFVFAKNGSNYTLYEYNGRDTDVELPESFIDGQITIKNYAISDYAFNNNKEITSIIIPNNVTAIGQYAFNGCSNLIEVIIGDSVTSIGNYAFYKCSSLKKLTIGMGVTSFGQYAFAELSSLEEVLYKATNVSGTNNYSYFRNSGNVENGFKVIFAKNVTYLPQYLFYGYTDVPVRLTEIEFEDDSIIEGINNYVFGYTLIEEFNAPDSLKTIGNYAFSYCKFLKDVNLNNATTIGQGAFYDCSVIETIDLKDVSNIGNSAFANCTSLKKLDLSKVTTLGTNIAYQCSSLEEIIFNENITAIPSYTCYYCSNLKGVVIPSGVTLIGSYAFGGCSLIDEVVLPDNIKTIEAYTFYYCTKLAIINLPSGLEAINNYAFANCNALTNVVMPNTVKTLGQYAFYNCQGLKTVRLSTSLTTISFEAFYNCYNLVSAIIPSGVAMIDDYAFDNCSSLEEIGDLSGVQHVGYQAFRNCNKIKGNIDLSSARIIESYAFYGCQNITGVKFGIYLTSVGEYAFYGCISLEYATFNSFDVDVNRDAFYNCSSLKTVTNPGCFNIIYEYAFAYCSSLESVELNEGLVTISQFAFRNSGIISLSIPETVTAIGTSAFYYCSKLEHINIPSQITTIYSSTFYNCSSLVELIIPDNVTTIDTNALYGLSNLETLVIPNNIKTFDDFVFNNLKTITIGSEVKYLDFGYPSLEDAYILSEEVAQNILYSGSYGTLGCATNLYIKNGLTITDYVTDHYEYEGTKNVDGVTYKLYTLIQK